MKTIIAPIDFSDASANALSFAAELSKRASANLIVANALQQDEDEVAARAKLENTLTGLKTFFGSGLNCQSAIVRGSLVNAVEELTGSHHPDLIIMGTKGASGLKRILIGSNTVNVLANTSLPVLVIPEAAQFEDFHRKGKNRIILATDLEELENPDGLDILKEIALLIIEPKLRILSVRPKNTNLDFQKQMERSALLSIFRPEIESERVTVFSGNVMSGINFYLDKNDDTGLVAMVARDSGQLIQKHYTREMASHTNYPLLILHDGTN